MGLSMQDVLFLANDDNVSIFCVFPFLCMCVSKDSLEDPIYGLLFNWLSN